VKTLNEIKIEFRRSKVFSARRLIVRSSKICGLRTARHRPAAF
jgi:hypothetical protein